MSGVFISYRREDAAASAGRLFDHLSGRFGRAAVFMDVDAMEPGVDFVEVLGDKVASCDALIAVIGPGWLEARGEDGGRRLDNEDDFVRIEIAAALSRNVRVIPLLVDGARMPKADDLPEDLKPLARRNAAELSHARFSDDVDRLAGVLGKVITTGEVAAPSSTPVATAPGRIGGDLHSRLGPQLARFADGKKLMVWPQTEEETVKAAAARRACGLVEGQPIIALVDFTVLGNFNDALILDAAGLHVHHSSADFPQPQHISLDELVAGPLEKHGWWQIRIGATRITVSGGPSRDVLMDMLAAVRAALG